MRMIHRYEWFLYNFIFKIMLLSFIFKKPWVLNSLVTKPKVREESKSVILRHLDSIFIFRKFFILKILYICTFYIFQTRFQLIKVLK